MRDSLRRQVEYCMGDFSDEISNYFRRNLKWNERRFDDYITSYIAPIFKNTKIPVYIGIGILLPDDNNNVTNDDSSLDVLVLVDNGVVDEFKAPIEMRELQNDDAFRDLFKPAMMRCLSFIDDSFT